MADNEFDAYLAAAEEAFRRDSGDAALDGAGFTELLTEPMNTPRVVDPAYATFVAHGRRLGRSSALFRLMAAPYLRAAGSLVGDVVACPVVQRTGGGVVVVAPAVLPGARILVDLGAARVVLVEAQRAPVVDAVPFDPMLVAVRAIADDDLAASVTLDLDRVDMVRAEATAAARLAAAHEILGAAEALLEIGRRYANDRIQFGQRIADFQAVRHLLATASLDIQSTAHLCRAVRRGLCNDPIATTVAKAVAGRNGRRAADRIGQVLGGIGFTWEHPFHTYHRRIVVLDGLIGSSFDLFADLGRAMADGLDPASVLPLIGQAADLGIGAEALA
jgi:hypothetical protein